MKDRLSIHIDNGQSGVREAVTILRNGGSESQPGMVGITNANYPIGQQPIIPETIFNVQSTGNSNIRFSSGPSRFYKSSIELLGNGNTRASGLQITYDPEFDNSSIDDSGYVATTPGIDPGVADNTVVDFSLIRPSGCEGLEFSHISISERGFVTVGLTKVGSERLVEANAPLTVGYVSNSVSDSGTISMLQQADEPEVNADFGKIYVKPFTVAGRTQALFFKDDGGTETNLILSEEIDPLVPEDGLIFGHNGNTYGGWFTPSVRIQDFSKFGNTYYGWGAGFHLGDEGFASGNSLVGYRAGSGLMPSSSYNTVFGHDSLTGFEDCFRNIIIGHKNVTINSNTASGTSDSIVIGHSLYENSLPDSGTFALGISTPILVGRLLTQRSISVIDAAFSVVETSNCSTTFYVEDDSPNSRFASVIDVVDYNVSGETPARNTLKFTFSNISGSGQSLLTLDPSGGAMTNTPSYATPAVTVPFAQIDGDLRLRGAIRFQDGTSMSGLDSSNLFPITAVSGTDLRLIGGVNNITLDYSNLSLAGNVSEDIRTDNTFVALQLDGSGSKKVGKLSLQGLAGYIASGIGSVAENCNMVLSNVENKTRINTSSMSRSVFIGCDVAYGASGWKHAVIIGSEAGANATVTNPLLDMDKACIFIGHRAGYDADNLDELIAIGTNAGKDSDGSSNSVFVGSNAGLNSTSPDSIGLGSHALRSAPSGPKGGTGNLEIVCGIDDNDRLMYNAGNLSSRLNIMNVIAGRKDIPNISVGKPRLSPTSPLEVRRDSVLHASNPNNYVQAWYCDNNLVASVDCIGTISAGSVGHSPIYVEGIADAAIGTGSMGSPTSGIMSIYEDGVYSGNKVFIVNRNSSLSITSGDYVFAAKIRNQYRPISVS
jgi:hypothetical protein